MENRNGLIVNTEGFEANGTAERDAALVMLEQIPGTKQVTVGGHKAYWVARLGRLYNVHLVSGLDPDFVRRCHFIPVSPAEHEAALRSLLAQAGADARVAAIPYSGVTLPAVQVAQEVLL